MPRSVSDLCLLSEPTSGGGVRTESQPPAHLLGPHLLHQQVDDGGGVQADDARALRADVGREERAHLLQGLLHGHL